jgi:hypothetical protein
MTFKTRPPCQTPGPLERVTGWEGRRKQRPRELTNFRLPEDDHLAAINRTDLHL